LALTQLSSAVVTNCPRTSIYEASERDFRIALAEDAISGLYPRGKVEMNNIGVWVADTATILKAFNTANHAFQRTVSLPLGRR
jgi:hypothetical protein